MARLILAVILFQFIMNLSVFESRSIKKAKIYCRGIGLVCSPTRWFSPEVVGSGAALENFTFSPRLAPRW